MMSLLWCIFPLKKAIAAQKLQQKPSLLKVKEIKKKYIHYLEPNNINLDFWDTNNFLKNLIIFIAHLNHHYPAFKWKFKFSLTCQKSRF